jgi:hypothetical protein
MLGRRRIAVPRGRDLISRSFSAQPQNARRSRPLSTRGRFGSRASRRSPSRHLVRTASSSHLAQHWEADLGYARSFLDSCHSKVGVLTARPWRPGSCQAEIRHLRRSTKNRSPKSPWTLLTVNTGPPERSRTRSPLWIGGVAWPCIAVFDCAAPARAVTADGALRATPSVAATAIAADLVNINMVDSKCSRVRA